MNLTGSIYKPFDAFLKANNVYNATLWLLGSLFLIQLDKILDELKNIQNKVFKRHLNFSVEDLVKRTATFDQLYVFYHLNNDKLLNKLLYGKNFGLKQSINIYINPKIIKSIPLNRLNRTNYEYYIAEVPNGYCTIFCLNNDKVMRMETVKNYHNRKGLFSLELKNDEELLSSYFESYSQSYIQKNLDLSNPLLVTLIGEFQDNYEQEMESLFEAKNLKAKTRDKFFQYAISLVNSAKKSFKAVDFIGPEIWTSDYHGKNYAQAHSVDIPIKIRIHVYDKTLLESKSSDYRNYINVMTQVGVELLFCSIEVFERKQFEKRGSLVVDDSCVIVAINPDKGAHNGIMDFSKRDIDEYKERFEQLRANSISKSDFINLLNEE